MVHIRYRNIHPKAARGCIVQDPAEVKMNAICAQCRYGTCYANKVGTQALSTPVAITPYTTTTAIYIYIYTHRIRQFPHVHRLHFI